MYEYVYTYYIKSSHGNKIIIVSYTKSHFLKTPSAFASIATILSTYNDIIGIFIGYFALCAVQ